MLVPTYNPQLVGVESHTVCSHHSAMSSSSCLARRTWDSPQVLRSWREKPMMWHFWIFVRLARWFGLVDWNFAGCNRVVVRWHRYYYLCSVCAVYAEFWRFWEKYTCCNGVWETSWSMADLSLYVVLIFPIILKRGFWKGVVGYHLIVLMWNFKWEWTNIFNEG